MLLVCQFQEVLDFVSVNNLASLLVRELLALVFHQLVWARRWARMFQHRRLDTVIFLEVQVWLAHKFEDR